MNYKILDGLLKQQYEDISYNPLRSNPMKKKIRRAARSYWNKHVKQHGIDIKIFTKKAEEFYNLEIIPRKKACQKAYNALCYEHQLRDLLK